MASPCATASGCRQWTRIPHWRRTARPTPFHYQHYVSRAMGGFGMIIMEATAALKGRISPCDLGLWDDGQMDAWRWIVADAKAAGANDGGAAQPRRTQGSHRLPRDRFRWTERAGGARRMADGLPKRQRIRLPARPRALSVDEIHTIVDQFRDAAWRAMNIGFDAVEVHTCARLLAVAVPRPAHQRA